MGSLIADDPAAWFNGLEPAKPAVKPDPEPIKETFNPHPPGTQSFYDWLQRVHSKPARAFGENMED